MSSNLVDVSRNAAQATPNAGMTLDRAGSLAGEPVRVKSQLSILEDAREEIGMHHSEKVESKNIEEREVEGQVPVRIRRIEHINAYLEATRRFDDARTLAGTVRQMQASTYPRDVARRASGNRTQQFALLQRALYGENNRLLPADEVAAIQRALDELELEAGREIDAGFNTVEAARVFAETADGVEQFQDAYVDIVIGEAGFAKTLRVVLDRLAGIEGDDLQRALDALRNALGADMAAARPSSDVVRLQALMQDIYNMGVATAVLASCRQLSAMIARQFAPAVIDPLALMKDLVSLIEERWVAPHRLKKMAERFHMRLLRARIVFHTGTASALRKMPVQAYADVDARQGLLDTAQAVLDELIAEEEGLTP